MNQDSNLEPDPEKTRLPQTVSVPDTATYPVSRRSFFKQTGGVAGAAVLLAAPTQTEAAAQPTPGSAPTLGPKAVLGTLLVNGKTHKLMIEPNETLAVVLREKLGLTGTKVGCDRGACGACTVVVGGGAQLSCMTLALDVAGVAGQPPLAVTTAEGVATQAMSQLGRAFVEKDALQCGFCTPGLLMSCTVFVEQARAAGRASSVSETEIKHAISGNLCRCGSYPHVVQAVKTVLSQTQGGAK